MCIPFSTFPENTEARKTFEDKQQKLKNRAKELHKQIIEPQAKAEHEANKVKAKAKAKANAKVECSNRLNDSIYQELGAAIRDLTIPYGDSTWINVDNLYMWVKEIFHLQAHLVMSQSKKKDLHFAVCVPFGANSESGWIVLDPGLHIPYPMVFRIGKEVVNVRGDVTYETKVEICASRYPVTLNCHIVDKSCCELSKLSRMQLFV
jgi:hypothetical protein